MLRASFTDIFLLETSKRHTGTLTTVDGQQNILKEILIC